MIKNLEIYAKNSGKTRDNIAYRMAKFCTLALSAQSFTLGELSKELGVGADTLKRDMKTLQNYGFEFAKSGGEIRANCVGGGGSRYLLA